MKPFYFLSFLAITAFPILSNAQTLNPGDVVIIGYAADANVDEFSWVPLVNLAAGTKLYFTDAGYNTVDGNFMGTNLTDEILIKYTVPSGGILAGTVFTVMEGVSASDYSIINGSKFGSDFNGQLSLPNAGDQITVFQSTDDENVPATFGNTNFTPLFMVNGSSLSFTALNVGSTAITPASNIDNLTNLASGLTQGVNAVATGTGPLEADESDNARYTGITSGTREEILFAVSQLSNWTRYDQAFGNDLDPTTTPNGWTTNGVSQFTTTLSVSEDSLASQFIIFPNPSTDRLYISNNTGETVRTIKLFSLNGEMIMELGTNQSSIDISKISSGIYLLIIEIENNYNVVKKITKL